MASIASAALEGRRNGRVLMLGLGGGTIAADIMMSEPIDWSLQVTCVEADEDTAEAARLYFLPLMFEHANAMGGGAGAGAGAGAENMLRRLHVVTADAMRVVDGSAPEEVSGPFDVIVEDFAYQRHGYLGTGPAFWRAIRRRLCAPGGMVVVNTLYDTRDEMERLAADLREAGWKDVQRRVDRGLQARLWGRKTVAVHEWRPRDNMIFSAVNPLS